MYHLPRTHDITTTRLDLRQMMILGPLYNDEPYPITSMPVLADLRSTTTPWHGGLVLGGSTERLQREFGQNFRLGKLVVYHANAQAWVEGDSRGPEIIEYVSIVDPTGTYLVYKCRRRRAGALYSYVFPEQIDQFAFGLTEKSWFMTPAFAVLSGQHGYVKPPHSGALEYVFDYLDNVLVGGNLITPDLYDAQPLVTQILGLLNDVDLLARQPELQMPEDVQLYWLETLALAFPEWDGFLKRTLLKGPISEAVLVREVGPHTLDLSPPPPLTSSVHGTIFPIPINYLPIADRLEKIALTDFVVRASFLNATLDQVIYDSLVDRFAPVFQMPPILESQTALRLVFVELCRIYAILAPHIAPTLIELKITKTFNEEALIEFFHQEPRHDHAMHVDFALLSYCSVGLGRFFNTARSLPN
jgi:hypothetical protein